MKGAPAKHPSPKHQTLVVVSELTGLTLISTPSVLVRSGPWSSVSGLPIRSLRLTRKKYSWAGPKKIVRLIPHPAHWEKECPTYSLGPDSRLTSHLHHLCASHLLLSRLRWTTRHSILVAVHLDRSRHCKL